MLNYNTLSIMSDIKNEELYYKYLEMLKGLYRINVTLMMKRDKSIQGIEKKNLQSSIDKLTVYKKKLQKYKCSCYYKFRNKNMDEMGTIIDKLMSELSIKHNIPIPYYETYHQYSFYNGCFIRPRFYQLQKEKRREEREKANPANPENAE